MTNEPYDDRQARELLRGLEQDNTQVSARREEIRQRMLDHYDNVRELQGDNESGDLIVNLGPASGTSDQSRPQWWIWLGAAAAMAVVLVGAALFTNRGGGELDTASPQEVPTSINESETTSTTTSIPAADELSLANGEIAFALPEGLVLVSRSEGLLVFGATEAATGLRETIVVLDSDTADLRARLNDFVTTGDARIGSTGNLMINGQAFDTWRINVVRPDPNSTCGEPGGCLELIAGTPESAIPVGLDARVDELVSSSGASVVALSDNNGALQAQLNALFEAATIS